MAAKIHMPHWPPVPFVPPAGQAIERMRALLEKLGNPQERLPPVVHVAGTNGKGSTIAFLRAMCEAANYKVHVYTSPHLIRFNERIRLAGELISDAMLAEATETTRAAAGDMNLSFFEATTAMALLAFSRAPADIMLVETGMGGVFDPTNVLDKKLLTIITTISFDHTNYLGKTLTDIAAHKAGVLRKNVPCIVSFQPEEAGCALTLAADIIGAPLYSYGRHWTTAARGGHFHYRDSHGGVDLPLPNLLGAHQLVNAGNAIAAVTALTDFIIPGEAIEQGLTYAEWPGRMERIGRGPMASLLPAGWELWFDGGHNAAGGAAIAECVKTWNDRPLYMIFGTTRGKEMKDIFAPFAGILAHVYGIAVAAEPNCYSAQEVAAAARTKQFNATTCENMEDAVNRMVRANISPARILVFGSLYHRMELVG